MVSDARARLGFEHLTEVGASPLRLIELAAGCGAGNVGILPEQWSYNPLRHPYWSLLADRSLRIDVKTALADSNVSVSLGEGFPLRPDTDVREFRPLIDLYRELGARGINGVPLDPDRGRLIDVVGHLAMLCADADLELDIEFAPILSVPTLPDALALIDQVGMPSIRVLLDIMHFTRAGHLPHDLDRIDPNMIGYVQVCDIPLVGTGDYTEEAVNERLPPGQGGVRLREIVRRLPAGVVLSAEVPQLRLAQADVPAERRFAAILAATAALLNDDAPASNGR